ncbi:hypothetical protein GCM10027408_10270 [Microbacterium tumbae]
MARQLRLEIDEDGAGDVASVVFGTPVWAIETPTDVEDTKPRLSGDQFGQLGGAHEVGHGSSVFRGATAPTPFVERACVPYPRSLSEHAHSANESKRGL